MNFKIKALAAGLALALLAGPAMAGGLVDVTNNNNDAKAKAEAEAAALALANSKANAKTGPVTQNTSFDSGDVDYYNPGAASAAGNTTADCWYYINVDARAFIAGAGVGIPQEDEDCKAAQLVETAIRINKFIERPELLELAADNYLMVLQKRTGYEATVQAIKEHVPVGETRRHLAKPYWCNRVKASSTESDKRACGVTG